MHTSLFVVAFASVVSAVPSYIAVADTNCVAVADAPDVRRVLVGCTNGVYAVHPEGGVLKGHALRGVRAIAVDSANHYAYLCQKDNLTVIRTSEITTSLANVNLTYYGVSDVTTASFDARGYLFLSTTIGIVVINVKVPRSPVVVYQDKVNVFSMSSGAYDSDRQLFMGATGESVVIYDVSTPSEGVLLSKHVMQSGSPVGMIGALHEAVAVCTLGDAKSLWILSTDDPKNPVYSVKSLSDACDYMATNNKDTLCTVSDSKATLYDVSGTSAKEINSYPGPPNARSAALSEDGNSLYVGLSSQGLAIYYALGPKGE